MRVFVFFECTHQSVFVRQVVGEFELVEGDDLLHPLLAGVGAVRVDVHPLGHLGVGLPGHDPPAEIKRDVRMWAYSNNASGLINYLKREQFLPCRIRYRGGLLLPTKTTFK